MNVRTKFSTKKPWLRKESYVSTCIVLDVICIDIKLGGI
jgi:hypothetical protein